MLKKSSCTEYNKKNTTLSRIIIATRAKWLYIQTYVLNITPFSLIYVCLRFKRIYFDIVVGLTMPSENYNNKPTQRLLERRSRESISDDIKSCTFTVSTQCVITQYSLFDLSHAS